jgi:hypothetical protein
MSIGTWPPRVTDRWTLRGLAAGYLVRLEDVGQDFLPGPCRTCGETVYVVTDDPHGTAFNFHLSGAARHVCGAVPPPGDHPAWTAREHDQQQAELAFTGPPEFDRNRGMQ